jgi:hypothetical protein
MRDTPGAAEAAEAVVAGECVGAVVVECAVAAGGASEAVRRLADFQVAAGLPRARAAAREAEWRTAAAPASTAGRRSGLPVERTHRHGREAAQWPEADRRCNRGHGHPLAAAREVPGPDLV